MRKLFTASILVLGVFLAWQVQALTISPAKFVISANPGEVIKLQMRIRNDLEKTLTHYPSFEKYTVKDGEEPVFLPEESGLPTWMEANPPQLTLEPKESAEVEIIIKVPEDAEPGGHYAAIFWQTAPPEGEAGKVAIVTKVGALVLLEVSGQVIEQGEIVTFSAPKKVFNYLPISFSFALKNTGTVHLGPQGKVVIKNIFGKTKAILTVNPGQYHVLPDTTRTFYTQNWEPKGGLPKIEGKGFLAELKREKAGFALGYYKANLSIEYGKERKTAQASFGFWVLPWRLLLISVLILAVIILIFTKGIQKYNQWVIEKAKERLKNE